ILFFPGCTAGGLSLNSKTFTKMLQSCLHRCEHHRVILEAEERYRGELRRVAAEMLLAPVKKDRLLKEIPTFKSKKDSFQSILLTPNRKDKSNASKRDEHSRNIRWTSNYNLTPAYEKCEYYQKMNSLIRTTERSVFAFRSGH
ncbi:hypothetical protein DV515_00012620, partial [Chloebia gouldiae]